MLVPRRAPGQSPRAPPAGARGPCTIGDHRTALGEVSSTATRHDAWLDLVGDLLQARPRIRDFPHAQVADLLLASFDAACCSLNAVDAGWADHVVAGWPEGFLPATPPGGYLPDATTHPLIRWYAVTGSAAVQNLGRVPRTVAPEGLVARWSEFARPLGIAQQLALPLRTGDGVEAYVVSRPDDDYDDDAVALAGSVLPALAALVGQHRAVHGAAAEQCGRGEDLGLTEREFAVLRLLGTGLTAVAIAHRLRTSPRTVHKHLEHVYRKLGVRDRLMAVQRARDAGLLTTPTGNGTRDPAPALPRPRREQAPATSRG